MLLEHREPPESPDESEDEGGVLEWEDPRPGGRYHSVNHFLDLFLILEALFYAALSGIGITLFDLWNQNHLSYHTMKYMQSCPN